MNDLTIGILSQALNGVQFGVLLFLLAAGLTLVFSIMNVVNIAHGSFFMLGAYVMVAAQAHFGFGLSIVISLFAAFAVGALLERTIIRHFYDRGHLDQVLVTFGLTLFFNELVRIVFGPAPVFVSVPAFLDGSLQFGSSFQYPTYRLVIIVVGLLAAALIYVVIGHTRLGILIRAGSWNRTMVEALGVNISLIYLVLFAAGAMLAGLAGVVASPILSVQPGMGDSIIIVTFVVIVIGGIGSIKGTFIAAMLVGVVDTLGRITLPFLFSLVMNPAAANAAGPAVASMLIYLLMAVVLVIRPQGLFAVQQAR